MTLKLDNRWLLPLAAALAIAALAAWGWQRLQSDGPGPGFASGNGRIEAVSVDIAAKHPGRVAEILVDEGDFIEAGRVVARMDTLSLEAQIAQARARVREAESARATAVSQVAQRRAEHATAEALVVQRRAERDVAAKRLKRARALLAERATSQQQVENDEAALQQTEATLRAARAQVTASEAAIAAAEALVGQAEASIEAAEAAVRQLQTEIDDSSLTAPRAGRVQYRVAQPGEVIGAGAPILNLVDLSDVYMTFFLPTAQAGRTALGAEARIVLDAAPGYVIPAHVSFVADVSQFTPKTVETELERQKLMFRIKARIPPELLRKHLAQVKTGLPGMVHVRLDPAAPWPDQLRVNLPQ